ncbi:prolyl oligopeptidase family serine peptidase [Natronoglycomyces albus]|uniref:S9 family peptidase n=1 Tax=Natronoglycomyces albus TaxID=2811108 RepID=A0A895XTE9_9ACTN|nr:prolyl oligopeptidase family serine peptidase [Natronoglycomyces albus]QSB04908.1 S9 family peptidase [Natronoglycomyces albus]
MTTELPYGSWPSPITVDMVAEGDGRPGFLGMVGSEVWWTVPRPSEGGRRALVRRDATGDTKTVVPAPWNVRNRVHEYGGQPWAGHARPTGGPLLVFTHYDDQRLYVFEPDLGGQPRPLTPDPAIAAGLRWCDMVIRPELGEVWAVLEEFTSPKPTDLRRLIVAIPLDGSAAADRSAIRELTDDTDRFTTGPRLNHDSSRAAWISWNHPDMPWDATELKVAEVSDKGVFANIRTVAGGGDESISQAQWAPDGTLVYASDRTGWWNLYRLDEDTGKAVNLYEDEREYAGPLWSIGMRWFEILQDGRIATIHGKGEGKLGILDPATGTIENIEGPWTEWAPTLAAHRNDIIGLAASPATSYEIVSVDATTTAAQVIGNHHADQVDPAYYPQPQSRTFAGVDGREVHAHVYPPRNPRCTAREGELPPYVVWVHGGPTSNVRATLDLELAYFTSRGIGVVNVNYGGSTSYGREYRNRLRHQWGIVDVEDCASVARQLAQEGEADPDRLAIRGGSAGGWTSAASLASPAAAGLYACATIQYPILDLSGWMGDETHDFESQYLHTLIGPYSEVPDRYRDRSPVNHAERITAPFVLLQGLEDAICPPIQSEKLLESIAGKGIPHAYLTYEGEQHGFRRASTIKSAIETEHSLYAQTFGFDGPTGTEVKLQP